MRLSQHATNVATSGHQWNNTVNNANWDWVVLQDQSQIPGFPRTQQEWINSKDGAVAFHERRCCLVAAALDSEHEECVVHGLPVLVPLDVPFRPGRS